MSSNGWQQIVALRNWMVDVDGTADASGEEGGPIMEEPGDEVALDGERRTCVTTLAIDDLQGKE